MSAPVKDDTKPLLVVRTLECFPDDGTDRPRRQWFGAIFRAIGKAPLQFVAATGAFLNRKDAFDEANEDRWRRIKQGNAHPRRPRGPVNVWGDTHLLDPRRYPPAPVSA